MERMISSDISRLQAQVDSENSSEDNELLEALAETKSLLSKIKELQRRGLKSGRKNLGNLKMMPLNHLGMTFLHQTRVLSHQEMKYPFHQIIVLDPGI